MIKFGGEEIKKKIFSETNKPMGIFEIKRNKMVLSDVLKKYLTFLWDI